MKITIKPITKNESLEDIVYVALQTKKNHQGVTVIVEPVKGAAVQVMEYETTDSLLATLLQVVQNVTTLKNLRKKP